MTGKEQTWFSLLYRVACSATRWDYVTLRLKTRYKTWIVTHWRPTWSFFQSLEKWACGFRGSGVVLRRMPIILSTHCCWREEPLSSCFFFAVFGATLVFVLRGSFRRLGSVQMWCYADDENSCMLLVMWVLSIVPLDIRVRFCTGLAHYG